jgi:opacity protein-like surface antigen
MAPTPATSCIDCIRSFHTKPMILMNRPLPYLLFLSFAGLASAGSPPTDKSPAPFAPAMSTSRFDKGYMGFQSATGAYFSTSTGDSDETTLNYTLSTYRVGFMLNEVKGEAWWHGNTELLVEGFFGTVLKGPGDYLGGANLALRYNFIPFGTNWTPYVQAAAGGFFSDIHPEDTRGNSWDLNLQASAGVRYLLTESWSISLEAGYQRVSSLRIASGQQGLDALGAQIGFSRFF